MSPYEQLDAKAFERYFSGIGHERSVRLYLKTGQLFLNGFDTKLNELAEHLASERVQDAIIIAHRLKGSLLTLGGNVLAEVFRKIEMELDAHNSAEFLRLLKKQDASTATFVSELRDWMKQLETSIPDLDES